MRVADPDFQTCSLWTGLQKNVNPAQSGPLTPLVASVEEVGLAGLWPIYLDHVISYSPNAHAAMPLFSLYTYPTS
jgi:hypothetical protein